jgi:predicted PurR-regulated permease PerM
MERSEAVERPIGPWWKRGRTWALLVVAALLAACFHALIWNLLSQVLLGAAVACALCPLCKLLERGMPRSVAALCTVAALLVAAALLITLLVPPLIRQMSLLADQVPLLMVRLRALTDGLSARMNALGLPKLLDEGVWQRAGELAGVTLGGVARQAGGLVAALSRLSLAIVLAFYFLRDREMFLHRLAMLAPLVHRRRALLAAAEMRREVGGYLRGQAIVSVSVGSLTALGLLIAGTPGWLALGVWMMLFDLIPYFGPFLGAIPILIFSMPGGFTQVLWGLGVVLAAQQLENNVISPRVLGGCVGLHPVAVILALSGGSALMGVWGLMLALPAVVAARGALRVLRCREEPQYRLGKV